MLIEKNGTLAAPKGELRLTGPILMPEEEKTMGEQSNQTAETFAFQAETKQLLNLVIHSLYANKDIFLRELISNASDALDKLRFESLTKPELLPDATALEIRLEVDQQNRTLTITDNGIGMGRDEVVGNIGTIAKSAQTHPTPVSYTHLTLPTIYSV